MNTTEFKIGDIVTFKSYHEAIKAKVIDAFISTGMFCNREPFALYELHGVDKPLLTRTTGRSIVESVDYVEYDPENPENPD